MLPEYRGWETTMKRAYVKPELTKRQKLSAATAQVGNSNDSQAPE